MSGKYNTSKILLTVLLTVFSVFAVFAQKDKVQPNNDFTGTWILDDKSSFYTKDRENFKDFILTISQNETEIKLLLSFTFRQNPLSYAATLFIDGRGEENSYPIRKYFLSGDLNQYNVLDALLQSKTSLKKSKVVRKGKYKHNNQFFDVTEIYNLSKGGKTLTLVTEKTLFTVNNSFGAPVVDRNLPTSLGYNFTFHKM